MGGKGDKDGRAAVAGGGGSDSGATSASGEAAGQLRGPAEKLVALVQPCLDLLKGLRQRLPAPARVGREGTGAPRPVATTAKRCAPSPGSQQPQQQHELTTESWCDADTHVTASPPREGFFCTLEMTARVPLPPDEVYGILTSPTNHTVFRSIKAIKNRRVLKQEHGRETIEQEQVGRWRVGPLQGVFSSHLIVEQDSHARTVAYRLAKPGFMRDFAGSWKVQPFDNAALDELVNHHAASPLHRLQAGLARLEGRLLGRQPSASLVRLQQSLLPNVAPPPPLDKIISRIAANQLFAIMGDLRKEANRRNKARQAAEQAEQRSAQLGRLGAHARAL
eukprot:scaffold3.g6686.t1